MNKDCSITRADALDFLHSLPEGSVDLVLTDPPYGTTDCSWDAKAPAWNEIWAAIWRALKPNGAALVFSQMPPAIDVINAARRQFRHQIVWEKTHVCGFLTARKMPMRAHELVLVFYRKLPNYTAISVPEQAGKPYARTATRDIVRGSVYTPRFKSGKQTPRESKNGERLFRDVIKLGKEASEKEHPTQKPVRLLRYLVRAYSQPGDLVIDPYAGAGSTGVAAALEGRRFAGCDISAEYVAISQRRLAEAVIFPHWSDTPLSAA